MSVRSYNIINYLEFKRESVSLVRGFLQAFPIVLSL